MASIFEQYQSTLAKEVTINVPETSGLGYVSIPKEQAPMFKKQKLNIKFDNEILFTCISNNWLMAIISDLSIYQLNLSHPDQQNEFRIEPHTQRAKVTGMFLDPLGFHLVLTLGAAKGQPGIPGLLYLQRTSTKPRMVTRFKDCQVTAVAWNWDNKSEATTGWILFGNAKGQIFESELGPDGDKVSMLKPIFELGEGSDKKAITGIKFFR